MLDGLSRCGRAGLLDRDGISLCRSVVIGGDIKHRRAGLFVPAAELCEIDTRGVLHRLHEIVGGDGLTVVTPEVEIHALAKTFRTQQGVLHAHHLGAFFVHGHGVEVTDFHIRGGPDGVGHRTGILGELRRTQAAHFLYALQWA